MMAHAPRPGTWHAPGPSVRLRAKAREAKAMRKLFHALFGEDPEHRRRIYWMLGAFVALVFLWAFERWS